MNCLQLVQFVQAQVGTSTDLPWAGPSTLVGITGQYLEFFNWVQAAYKDIQLDQMEWRWRNKQGTLNLSSGQKLYTLANITSQLADYEDIAHLHFIDDQRYGLVYDSTIGVADETYCHYVSYQDWRGWKDRNVAPSGKPVYYTKRDDGGLEFSPTPDKATYVFVTDYKTALDTFVTNADGITPNSSTNTDTPLYMPAQYHEAIAWKAVMYWAMQRQNAAKYEASKVEYDRIMNKMYAQYLPDIKPYLQEYYG